MLGLVMEIEEETAAMHRLAGTRPLGPKKVLAMDAHHQPEKVKKSPRPWFHAHTPEVRKALRTALLFIVTAYRQAAEALKAGEYDVRFPAHTFPPGLPYVRTGSSGVEVLGSG